MSSDGSSVGQCGVWEVFLKPGNKGDLESSGTQGDRGEKEEDQEEEKKEEGVATATIEGEKAKVKSLPACVYRAVSLSSFSLQRAGAAPGAPFKDLLEHSHVRCNLSTSFMHSHSQNHDGRELPSVVQALG